VVVPPAAVVPPAVVVPAAAVVPPAAVVPAAVVPAAVVPAAVVFAAVVPAAVVPAAVVPAAVVELLPPAAGGAVVWPFVGADVVFSCLVSAKAFFTTALTLFPSCESSLLILSPNTLEGPNSGQDSEQAPQDFLDLEV